MNNEAMMSQVDESQSPDRLAVPTENQVNVAKIRRKLAEDRYEVLVRLGKAWVDKPHLPRGFTSVPRLPTIGGE